MLWNPPEAKVKLGQASFTKRWNQDAEGRAQDTREHAHVWCVRRAAGQERERETSYVSVNTFDTPAVMNRRTEKSNNLFQRLREPHIIAHYVTFM